MSKKQTRNSYTRKACFAEKLHFSSLLKLSVLIVGSFVVVMGIMLRNITTKQELDAHAAGASSFICGANTDSQMIQKYPQAKQTGATTIRFGYGPNWMSNLQGVKNAGLQPLIILHGCGTTDPALRLQGNIQMLQDAHAVFGANAPIYWEIGNENDLQCGLSAAAYTSMWNAMVPQLKQMAPNDWFIGPVNFQSNAPYIASFVQNATPKPDAVSWHEYTCGSGSPNSYCIQHIANWTTHVTSIKTAITATGNTIPPLMITEWNYAPDGGVYTDTKHNDPAFMTQWTTTALQTLITNNIYASYQFNVTNATPLIGSPQGQVFQQICAQISSGNGTTPSTTPNPSVSVSPAPSGNISPTITPTINATDTVFSLTLCPHGLGNCGDNVNPTNGGGNTAPQHTSLMVKLTILDAANNAITSGQGTVTYNQTAQNFQGPVAIRNLPAGSYLATVQMNGFLTAKIPGIITVTQGQIITLPSISLVNGDINTDNQLDILDYNILIGCYGSKQSTTACTAAPTLQSPGADINDDKVITAGDYNLFLRELSVQRGG